MLVIDLKKMMDPTQFAERLEAYTQEITGAPKALGSDKIFYPGEPNWIAYDNAVQNGLKLTDEMQAAAEALAQMAGLDLSVCV